MYITIASSKPHVGPVEKSEFITFINNAFKAFTQIGRDSKSIEKMHGK